MHIYKKVLPVAVAMALAACGGGSDNVEDQSQGAEPLGTYPKFNPVTSDLPLNTDLIFSGTIDGTANLGVATNPAEAGVNALDGFSVNAAFDIAFDGGSIDPASVCVPGLCEGVPNVFVVELDTSGDDGDALNPDSVVGVIGPAAVSASVVSLDGGTDNALRIAPLQPLESRAKYLVFVTNGVLDTNGDPIQPSTAYDLLGANEPAVTGDLAAVRGAVQGWESIAAQVLLGGSMDPVAIQAAADTVAISYTFTTSDPIAPLFANAAPAAAIVQAQTETFGVDPAAAVENLGELLVEGVALNTPVPRNVVVPANGVDLFDATGGALEADFASMYTGTIDLPYFLRTPETTVSGNYKLDSWQADQALGGALLPKIKADLSTEAAAALPPVLPLPDADGTTYNITYRYPFADEVSTETVPLQVTLPDPEYQVAPDTTCSAANPDGLPVVMYVHGIGSDRTSVVALAHSLAKACVATVAIDLPLHGGRAFDAADPALNFINLGVLTNTRDNLRQGVMDLLNLNASLDGIDIALQDGGLVGLDTTNVKVVGASLGGIVGSVYATVNQLAFGADNTLAQQVEAGGNAPLAAMLESRLNPLNGLVISASGGQLTQVLKASQTFGATISAGLAAEGVVEGSTDFARFLYVAQSVVDSGDPVNFASTLGGLGVPVLMHQIVGGGNAGDGKTYTADKVVPNSVEGAPLAGTTPLATLVGAALPASANVPGTTDVTGANLLVNLEIGHHASLLRPNEEEGVVPTQGELLATGELQTEVVTFVTNPVSTAVGTAGQSAAASNFVETAP